MCPGARAGAHVCRHKLLTGRKTEVSRPSERGRGTGQGRKSVWIVCPFAKQGCVRGNQFSEKASPGRGKLSPQVTDEGAGKLLLAGNHPSSGATRHLFPLLSLRDIFPRPGEICPQGVKAFALGQPSKVDFRRAHCTNHVNFVWQIYQNFSLLFGRAVLYSVLVRIMFFTG